MVNGAPIRLAAQPPLEVERPVEAPANGRTRPVRDRTGLSLQNGRRGPTLARGCPSAPHPAGAADDRVHVDLILLPGLATDVLRRVDDVGMPWTSECPTTVTETGAKNPPYHPGAAHATTAQAGTPRRATCPGRTRRPARP